MELPVKAFLQLRTELPVADVRSEGEYLAGHIPHAVNIPLLNNAARAAVGIAYKNSGQAEAIRTGFRLAGPHLADLIEQAEQLTGNKKELIAHCWRGGMRSDYFSRFCQMAGLACHTLQDGYKAYRKLAHQYFAKGWQLRIIGGLTGTGKTEILHALRQHGEQVIDLETLACHRGSVFGGLNMPPQPTTEQFENNLFEELLRMDISKPVWLEDESVAIGKVFLPQPLWKRMAVSPVIVLQTEKSVRIQRLVAEYAPADTNSFLEALKTIIPRLGHAAYRQAHNSVLAGNWADAINCILTYYDKAYLNGLNRRQHRIAAHIAWDGKNTESVVQQLVSQNFST
ncbi:MAG: tRNA 2-selenouridine synthase [Cyclobacteriaceae bacterium]|nr:MAG: tRNA 2-selenouridine synthase [Cyclobacteriaceae bacterium]